MSICSLITIHVDLVDFIPRRLKDLCLTRSSELLFDEGKVAGQELLTSPLLRPVHIRRWLMSTNFRSKNTAGHRFSPHFTRFNIRKLQLPGLLWNG